MSSLPGGNNLRARAAEGRVCLAIGVKLVQSIEIVEVATAAGYDALFIDMEHSQFSLYATSQICKTANLANLSPFVRVPHECGNGFVQRVLDGDAKGIIVPHVRSADDARRAVEMVKYPPLGIRSINPSVLMENGRVMGPEESAKTLASKDAVAFVMVETVEALRELDSIAAVPGLDVLVVGSMDITIELSILADWSNKVYQGVLAKVSAAAHKHGKLWGISGLFTRPDIWTHAIQNLGARFIVGSLDLGLLSRGARANVEALRGAELKGLDQRNGNH